MVGVAAFETMGHEVVKDLVRRYLSTNYFWVAWYGFVNFCFPWIFRTKYPNCCVN
jgi:hypothetical protein